MPIPLRRAVAADAAAIKQVVDAAYERWVPVIGRKPGPMMTDYVAATGRSLIDLHEIDNRPVALIEMRPKNDHLLIVNVAVSPNTQGRGLGRALMVHAEPVAQSLGLKETRLYTNTLMASNIAFYSDLGYQRDREEAFMQGYVLHMSKAL